jgi:hypothetical protein
VSEYNDLTNHDVLSPSEMADYERDARFTLDAADEADAAPEAAPADDDCAAEFIDGSWTYCGCEECQQAEYDAIEADVEYGAISEAEARSLHALNGFLD